jgi:hypothetical protein
MHKLKRAVGLVAILALPLAAQNRATKVQQSGTFTVTPGTGTFPISGTVECSNCGGEVATGGGNSGSYTVTPGTGTFPVSGTFWQAVQAVSQSGVWNVGATLAAETTKIIGTVNIAAGQVIGVTGTFWQATQPVSGTFWQATQPVSIAANVNVAQAANTSHVVVSSKVVTFVFTSTASVTDTVPITPSTGTSVLTVMNGGSSTHVLRIRRISATTHIGKSVGNGATANTGVAQLGVVPISAATLGSTLNIINRKMDTADGALDAQVSITTGGAQTFVSDTPLWSTLVAITTTTLINDRPDIIYEESMTAGKPFTLRPGEGFALIRSSQPRISLRGEIRATVIATQE